MKNKELSDKEKISKAFAAHEKEQLLYKVRNSTPEQRIKALEEMLKAFGPYKTRD